MTKDMTKREHGAGAVRGTPVPLRGHGRLRSDAWFTGDDEVAMQHRVAFATAGLEVSRRGAGR